MTFTKDQRARLPARPERSAHDHEHPGDAARRQVHEALHACRHRGQRDAHAAGQRRSAAPATSRSPSSRRCAARWTRSIRARCTPQRVPGRHRELPDRPLRRPDQRRAVDARREHRAVQGARRQDDARAEGAERGDAVQRLHAGALRAEDDRRVQAGQASRRAACFRSRSTSTTFCTGSGNEPAFGRQAVYLDDANVGGRPVRASPSLAGYKPQGINIWAPPIFALLTLDGQNRIVPSQARARRQGGRARPHHLDAGALGHPGRRQQRLLLPDDSIRRSRVKAT